MKMNAEYEILVTDNTNQMAETFGYNIAGLRFIPHMDLGDRMRGEIHFPYLTASIAKSPYTLYKSDLLLVGEIIVMKG
jgi:hypothetical protein